MVSLSPSGDTTGRIMASADIAWYPVTPIGHSKYSWNGNGSIISSLAADHAALATAGERLPPIRRGPLMIIKPTVSSVAHATIDASSLSSSSPSPTIAVAVTMDHIDSKEIKTSSVATSPLMSNGIVTLDAAVGRLLSSLANIAPYTPPPVPKDEPLPSVLFAQVREGVERVGLCVANGEFLYCGVTGSRLYNLQIPSSDSDLFIVWAAPTRHLLGLAEPDYNIKSTIKNENSKLKPDFVIVEVKQFVVQLLDCTPTLVESLWNTHEHASTTTVGFASHDWQQLVAIRSSFMTKRLCIKYLDHIARERSALSKLTNDALSVRALKKAYVLARLCIVLEGIIRTRRIDLWMLPDSDNWQRLMRIRQGCYDLPSLLTWSAVRIARYRHALGLTNDARSAGIMAATEVANMIDNGNDHHDDNTIDMTFDASDMADNADNMQQQLADWLYAIRRRSL